MYIFSTVDGYTWPFSVIYKMNHLMNFFVYFPFNTPNFVVHKYLSVWSGLSLHDGKLYKQNINENDTFRLRKFRI